MSPLPADFTPDTISIDKEGAFRHEGVKITHERTVETFFKALDVDEQGRHFLQVGYEKAYIVVEDAPYVVTALRLTDEGISLRLQDNSHHRLDPGSLRITAENVPYCKVRDGRMQARFSRTAWIQLAEFIQEKDGGYILRVNGESYEILFEN